MAKPRQSLRMRHLARASRLTRLYGITEQEYADLLELQNGRCGVCSRKPGKARLAVDHDHETGFVRGLLCHRCNKAIGYLDDNREVAQRAVTYLMNGEIHYAALTPAQEDEWLPFRGRANGMGRTRRLSQMDTRPRPHLPQLNEEDLL